MSPDPADNGTAIAAEGLGVRLGSHWALRGLDFALPAGALLAIIGPNGGGKSTLLKTLLGLAKSAEGQALLFGKPAAQAPADWIGYVPQFKTLDRTFPALAIELAGTGLLRRWPWRLNRSDRQAAQDALDKVGAGHLAQRRVGKLSGGELQRVYLARAVARKPKLILLDEPATGMDAAGESDLHRVLEERQKELGATIAMVTHDWGEAYHHATHVLALNRRAVGFGPAKETLTEKCLRETFGHVGHSHAMTFATPPEPAKKPSGEHRKGCGCDA